MKITSAIALQIIRGHLMALQFKICLATLQQPKTMGKNRYQGKILGVFQMPISVKTGTS